MCKNNIYKWFLLSYCALKQRCFVNDDEHGPCWGSLMSFKSPRQIDIEISPHNLPLSDFRVVTKPHTDAADKKSSQPCSSHWSLDNYSDNKYALTSWVFHRTVQYLLFFAWFCQKLWVSKHNHSLLIHSWTLFLL